MNKLKKSTLGMIMSGLVIAFMLMDTLFKFIRPQEVIDTTSELGWPVHHILTMGLLSLVVTILYLIPRTAILGAILMTGFFGGAIASNLRVDNPLFSHVLFPVYIGILAWGGLLLRNPQVKSIFTFKK
ncbi:DoxX family protein [Flexithrix dorotheae]|uniref:DoxX family protein n=1 Tax=Flexithrix dorotheae TaxID=70993 RepID=UPI0003829E16|nr:DoxX family protein [Flexithrix dorotheae]